MLGLRLSVRASFVDGRDDHDGGQRGIGTVGVDNQFGGPRKKLAEPGGQQGIQ